MLNEKEPPKKVRGRPESKNAPYFPHFTEPLNELVFLEKRYGAEGYRAFYRLIEMVTKADDHHIKINTENRLLTFKFGMDVPDKILDGTIDYLLEVDFIDNDLYHGEKIIWIEYLVNKLKPVYWHRKKNPPKKVGNKIVSGLRNSQKRKVSKEKKTKDKGSYTSINDLDIKQFKESYKDVDVDKSYQKYLKYYKNKNPSVEGFAIWLDEDKINGINHKQPEFTFYETGNVRVYCSKCNNREIAKTINEAQFGNSCCGVEWMPEPANG